jgi:cell division septal protein FtsQ
MPKPIRSKNKQRIAGLKRSFVYSLPYILSLAVAGLLFGGVIAYAVNSPTFELNEVKVLNIGTLTPDEAFKFCELNQGENLILLDLVNVQQVIKRRHPEFKEVLVRRVLPNRIEVMLKRRTPVAQVAFSRFVQVDKDLVILPGSSAVPFRNLTVFEGAPLPREGLAVGAALRDPVTKKALRLMEVVKRSNILRRHGLSKIDLGDPKNISLIVDSDIEIRIGNNHFIERLKILDQTLKTLELDRSKIRYIDLRFDDVVIGPR